MILWLRAHKPAPAEPRLVHGDPKLGNLLLSGSRLIALLDWEMSSIGDPLCDLGWLSFQWNGLTVVATLVKPLEAAFGWSRASIASATLITASGTLLFAPWVGAVVDRIGPRRVALVTLLMLAVATACIGLTGPSIRSWYLA